MSPLIPALWRPGLGNIVPSPFALPRVIIGAQVVNQLKKDDIPRRGELTVGTKSTAWYQSWMVLHPRHAARFFRPLCSVA
jgi:hypothetical protein